MVAHRLASAWIRSCRSPPPKRRPGAAHEAIRPQQPWPHRAAVELLPRARLHGPREPRAARCSHHARLRGEGPDRDRHPDAREVGCVRHAVRPAPRRGPQPALGEPLRDHDVREASDAMARRPAPTRGRLSAGPDALGGSTAQDRSGGRCVRAPRAGVGPRRRGSRVRLALRGVLPPPVPRHRAACRQADRGRDPGRPRCPDAVPRCPRSRLPNLLLRGDPGLQRGEARARGPASAGDGAPQPVSVGPRAGAAARGRHPGRRRRRGPVHASHPRRRGVPPSRPAR